MYACTNPAGNRIQDGHIHIEVNTCYYYLSSMLTLKQKDIFLFTPGILLCGMALDSCGVYAVHTLVHAAIEVMDTFKLLPELRMAKLHMGMHKGEEL